MIFEKIVYISIILIFLAYYIYRYIRYSNKFALANIGLQVIAVTLLTLIYTSSEPANMYIQLLVFICGYLIPIITFISVRFNINYINETKIIIANICCFCNHDDKSIYIYEKLEKTYKKYRVYKKLGEIYLKQGNLNSALQYLSQAIDMKPKNYKLYYKLAYIDYELQKYDESVTILNNILKFKPNYIPACNLKANILTFNKNDYNTALRIYFELLEIYKSNAKTYYNIGAIYIKENQNKNAKKFLESAIKYDNKLYNAHYLLGYIHYISEEYEISEQYLLTATKGTHTYAKSYYLLARLYVLQNEKGKATNCLNLAIERDDNLIEQMHNDNIFDSIKDLANGVDKIEKITNEKFDIEKSKYKDINRFEEMNIDKYIKFSNDTKKDETLATTIKDVSSNKVK